ncbi:MAG: HD domain-containing protein [Thermoleophilia bacterium]|nr:HD domain-containing protein [Thermoleophilia bacterium]
MVPIFDEIRDLFDRRGRDEYHGEAVSQSEHALQAAALAVAEGAPDGLVVAALLHDVGHLFDEPEDLAERGIDGRHEDSGAAWLERAFGPAVAGPVRLHVAAKRYLCATEPAYFAALSRASVLSLQLQGGPFDAAGVAAFEADPHFRDAVRLRRWDDAAKVPGLDVPGVAAYRDRIEAVARAEVSR